MQQDPPPTVRTPSGTNTGQTVDSSRGPSHTTASQASLKRTYQLPTSEAPQSESPARPGAERNYLTVPFVEKESAKALGAKWDRQAKRWFVPEGMDPKTFARWSTHRLRPAKIVTHTDVKQQFAAALREAGLVLTEDPIMDGKWHRTTVSTSTKSKALKGAYIGHLEDLTPHEVPNGYIKNHDTDYSSPWMAKGLRLSNKQRDDHARAVAETLARRSAELAAERQAVADAATRNWSNLNRATKHPYLQRKGVEAFGLKVDAENNLVVPMCDVNGSIWNLQRIHADPSVEKLYEKGGQKSSRFHIIGDLEVAEIVIFSEGYATAASVHMATGLPVVVCFDSGNIDGAMAELHPRIAGKLKVVAGDDDVLTDERIEQHLRKRAVSESGIGLGLDVVEADDIAKLGQPFSLARNPACEVDLRFVPGDQGVRRLEGHIRNRESRVEIRVHLANIGREKALAAAAAHGGTAVLPTFHSLTGRPTDFNDLHQREGLAIVRTQLLSPLRDLGLSATPSAVAERALGEGATASMAHPTRQYTGKVLANTIEHAVQHVGRSAAIVHALIHLDRVPPVGGPSRITYRGGHGVVDSLTVRQRTQER
ncbi:MAG: DUF5710 domain-containing protein [Rhodococcus sp. (in: high G+C Gram-positive bacteria)]|uniref:DUF5710 domain-containing protein n=1 Tax=Rhodococcus sp. TaxID=1831 RepID=UPI002ADA9897|nr:DUF5710 domain-containing protein [Rhodococcus sp. (in: high G+C Gram-positive bacteria)]